jgi:hypothetical protein
MLILNLIVDLFNIAMHQSFRLASQLLFEISIKPSFLHKVLLKSNYKSILNLAVVYQLQQTYGQLQT